MTVTFWVNFSSLVRFLTHSLSALGKRIEHSSSEFSNWAMTVTPPLNSSPNRLPKVELDSIKEKENSVCKPMKGFIIASDSELRRLVSLRSLRVSISSAGFTIGKLYANIANQYHQKVQKNNRSPINDCFRKNLNNAEMLTLGTSNIRSRKRWGVLPNGKEKGKANWPNHAARGRARSENPSRAIRWFPSTSKDHLFAPLK